MPPSDRYRDEGHVGARWGSRGSGLLLTDGKRVLLLLRSEEVMEPGTWGISGGAVPRSRDGTYMDDFDSALAEAREEMDGLPEGCERIGETVFEDGAFRYTTFIMQVPTFAGWRPRLNWEHDTWELFEEDMLDDLDLHPGVQFTLNEAPLLIFV